MKKTWIHLLAAAALLTPQLHAQRRLGAEELPEGSNIIVRSTERLDSEHNVTGDTFQGVLDQDLRGSDGRLFARSGSPVTGRLVEVRDAGKVSGKARMTLTLTDIDTGSGVVPIETQPISVEASGSGRKDAAVIGGSSALGAIIGAIAGGGKGAAIGAAVGAAAGVGGVLVTDGRDVQFEPEQRFNFVLARGAGTAGSIRGSGASNYQGDSQRRGEARELQRDQVEEIARALIDRTRRMRSLVRRGDPRTRELYDVLSTFASGTQTLARNAHDVRRPDLRQAVRELLAAGERISHVIDRNTDLSDAWLDVDRELVRLADLFGEPFEPARNRGGYGG